MSSLFQATPSYTLCNALTCALEDTVTAAKKGEETSTPSPPPLEDPHRDEYMYLYPPSEGNKSYHFTRFTILYPISKKPTEEDTLTTHAISAVAASDSALSGIRYTLHPYQNLSGVPVIAKYNICTAHQEETTRPHGLTIFFNESDPSAAK